MGEWREVDLDEVASELTVGHVGPMVSEYRDEGVPFIRSTDIEPFRIKRDQLKYINPEFHSRLKKSALKPGDVVIVRTGKPGTCAMIPVDLPDANCSDVVIVRTGPELDPRYLAYYINSAARAHIDAFSGGAVQQHFNVGAARRIRMNLPPIGEQERIVQVLGNLDAKIDLLHRQNKTLEAMTETLFRQWFVERRPEVLEGEAEEGWEEVRMDELCTVKIGRTPPRKESEWFSREPNDVKWISIKDMASNGAFIFNTDEYLTQEAVDRFSIPLIPAATVVLSFKMTLGRVKITTTEMLSNEAIAHFVPLDDRVTKEFLYLWLMTYPYDSLGSTSSIVTSINTAMIKEMKVAVPPESKMKAFMEQCGSWFLKMRANQTQIQTLTALRDTLLPKLMSGEVRVLNLT